MWQICLLQQLPRLCAMQDSTGNWGGSLILSTTTAGSTSSSSGQPVDRLTIDSSGLATFTAGQSLSDSLSDSLFTHCCISNRKEKE